MENRQEKHKMSEYNTESPGTVLIVEDSQGVNRLIQKRLEREGFRTEQAWKGTEAIAKVEENPDMIMILDYILPDMTAKQVIETLIEQHYEIPFITMTGHGDEQVAVDMMKLGSRDYIIKQGNFIEMLPQVVKRVLKALVQEQRLMKAELAQRESERRFRETLENVQLIAVMLDVEGKITFCNDYLLMLTGWKGEEIVGQDWFSNFLPSEIQQTIKSGFMQTIATGAFPAYYENEILTKSGERRLIAWSNIVLRDTNGNIIGTNSIGKDITERKQTEEKLLQLRKAVETMPLGVTITDLDKKILYTNPADATMHGYIVEELLGQDARIFAPVELRQPVSLEQIETSKNWIRESVNIRKDGSRFLVHLRSDIVRDANGQAIAIVTTCEDITERKRAEEALKLSEQKHRTLFETMAQGVIYQDAEGHILSANPAAERILGLTVDQMQGRTSMDPRWKAIHEDGSDFPGETHPAILALKTGKRVNDVVMGAFNSQEKKYCWINIHAIPQFRPGEDTPYQVYTTFADITEQKRTMEELRQARDTLEQRVTERTAELTLLNDKLARASRLKDEFLANMSHDLRTPLNAILGYAQILKDAENLDEHQVEALSTIKNSGEHLLSMINDILDLSKIEAGHLELQVNAIHLPKFLDSLTDMIRIRAEQKGVSFVYERAADLPVGLYADEKRLGEVLINLLGNAVKFTEKGSVTFRVKRIGRWGDGEIGRTAPHSLNSPSPHHPITPSPYLRFEVEDTGIGITSEYLGEIFLPFHQVGNNYHSLEGTGLGLAISQKLVEMMRGELQVKSTPGRGSLFWFELKMSEVPGFVSKVKPTTPKILGYTGQRCIVMVVDDVQENRAVLTSMLLPLGFKVVEAENGPACLEKSRRLTPDVILLDLLMPGMNGFEVARQIRNPKPVLSADEGSEIRTVIIAISASAFKEVQRKSLETGCDDFLAKPFQKNDLLELLRRHLRLEWIYAEEGEVKTDNDIPLPFSSETVASLPSGERKKLLQQAVRGNVKGILEQLAHIERLGGEFLPLVTKLRKLAKSFQVDRIAELLEMLEK